MKNLFITAIALLLVFPAFSQIQVISNGNVKIGNPSTSWQRLTVDGVIKSDAIYAGESGSVLKTVSVDTLFDSNNYAYFLNPNGKSKLQSLTTTKIFDLNNDNYYLDPASTSILNNVRVSKLWDRNNTDFYLDPNDVSNIHNLRVTKIWDRNNLGYFLDPHATSKINNLKATKLIDRNDGTFIVDPNQQSTLFAVDIEHLNSNEIVPSSTSQASFVGSDKRPYNDIWGQHIHFTFQSQFSDERTKDNIEDMKSPIEKLMALTAKTFDYKSSMPNYGNGAVTLGSHLKNRQGFIAQEVKEVIPGLVDFDENSGLYTMNYLELVPMLVKAFQEQQEEIKSLKEQLAK